MIKIMDREVNEFHKCLLLSIINDCKKNNCYYYNNDILKHKKLYGGRFPILVTIYLSDEENGVIKLNDTTWIYKNIAGLEIIQQI